MSSICDTCVCGARRLAPEQHFVQVLYYCPPHVLMTLSAGPGLHLHEAGAAPGQGDPDPVPAGQPVHAQPQPPSQVGDISTRVFIFCGKLSLEEIVILANKNLKFIRNSGTTGLSKILKI